jgi:cruciform cutting endonuclease 1
MPSTLPWLSKLKLHQLRRVAIATGTPCSGTKPVIIQGINAAVNNSLPLSEASIVTIDMGLKNLAIAHLVPNYSENGTSKVLQGINVSAWRNISIVDPIESPGDPDGPENEPPIDRITRLVEKPVASGAYHPANYAQKASAFVTDIIDKFRPTHILIERQRFRSGGQAAVQEWSIRVGVFEAMIYATLQTLKDRAIFESRVFPILPASVNRFWLESAEPSEPAPRMVSARVSSGREVKLQKIQLVKQILVAGKSHDIDLTFGDAALEAKALLAMTQEERKSQGAASSVLKLDDLSDSLLQGLAWIQWQKHRSHLNQPHSEACRYLQETILAVVAEKG